MGFANFVIHQDEFLQLRMVEGRFRTHTLICQSRRFGSGIAIESRALDAGTARPPTRADDLMRIGLAGNGIGALALWSAPAGKPRYRQVEASPEEMDRTALAHEERAKLFECRVARSKNAPKAMRRVGIIGAEQVVFGEGNGVWHFYRLGVDCHADVQGEQGGHEFAVK